MICRETYDARLIVSESISELVAMKEIEVGKKEKGRQEGRISLTFQISLN